MSRFSPRMRLAAGGFIGVVFTVVGVAHADPVGMVCTYHPPGTAYTGTVCCNAQAFCCGTDILDAQGNIVGVRAECCVQDPDGSIRRVPKLANDACADFPENPPKD